jgi:hypothetical protein
MSGKNRSVDVEKIKKAIVAFGKKKGHITIDELRELLPPDVVDHGNLDEWRKTLEDEGVSVVENEAAAKKAKAKSKRREREDSETGRTNDPVRMYLRKMGSVSLLTREGEVEIAKRIEEGERQSARDRAAQPGRGARSCFEMFDQHQARAAADQGRHPGQQPGRWRPDDGARPPQGPRAEPGQPGGRAREHAEAARADPAPPEGASRSCATADRSQTRRQEARRRSAARRSEQQIADHETVRCAEAITRDVPQPSQADRRHGRGAHATWSSGCMRAERRPRRCASGGRAWSSSELRTLFKATCGCPRRRSSSSAAGSACTRPSCTRSRRG